MVSIQFIVELLEEDIVAEMVVKGTSMYPAIFSGDKLKLEPYKKEENLVVGKDILLVETVEKRYVIHRVVGLNSGMPITKGDALDHQDENCLRVIGKVVNVKKSMRSRMARLWYRLRRK